MGKKLALIDVNLSDEAVLEYRSTFGSIKKVEMTRELLYFMKQHAKRGFFKTEKKIILNYDHEIQLVLDRQADDTWLVTEIMPVEYDKRRFTLTA